MLTLRHLLHVPSGGSKGFSTVTPGGRDRSRLTSTKHDFFPIDRS